MEPGKTIQEQFDEARQLEQSGDTSNAAAIYQKLVDNDPENQAAVARLLVMYRRLKEYGKELAVIDTVLAAYAQRDKGLQEKWLKAHPAAAGAGRSILKQLGGARVSTFGVSPVVNGLQKRRALVARRLNGTKKGKPKKRATAANQQAVAAEPRKAVAGQRKVGSGRHKRETDKRKAESAQRKVQIEQRKAQVAQRKAQVEQRKAEAIKRKAQVEQRKAQVEQRKAEAIKRNVETVQRRAQAAQRKQAAAEAKAAKAAVTKAAKARPSLFVITLHYLVSLDKIDATMPQHLAFLRKQYASGHFIVSGRQVPRNGGVIIARGISRDAVETLMTNDPFAKKKLARVEIIEFTVSQADKSLQKLLLSNS